MLSDFSLTQLSLSLSHISHIILSLKYLSYHSSHSLLHLFLSSTFIVSLSLLSTAIYFAHLTLISLIHPPRGHTYTCSVIRGVSHVAKHTCTPEAALYVLTTHGAAAVVGQTLVVVCRDSNNRCSRPYDTLIE